MANQDVNLSPSNPQSKSQGEQKSGSLSNLKTKLSPVKILLYVLVAVLFFVLGILAVWIAGDDNVASILGSSQPVRDLIGLPPETDTSSARAELADEEGTSKEDLAPEGGEMTYTNKDRTFQLTFPTGSVNIRDENSVVKLSHSVAHSHMDPCDWAGISTTPLTTLTDFEATFELHSDKLSNIIATRADSLFLADYLSGERLTAEEGFIEEYTLGNLKGYEVITGAEGCGEYSYYILLNGPKVLIVDRKKIAELDPTTSWYDDYKNVSGVMSQAEEQKFFEAVLKSFRAL